MRLDALCAFDGAGVIGSVASRFRRLRLVAREESASLQPRYLMTRLVTIVLPPHVGLRLRSVVWRWFGWDVGTGALLFGTLRLSGPGRIHRRLRIGDGVWINNGCRFDLSDCVTLESNVAIGQDVLIFTSTHQLGRRERRAGQLVEAPVVVEAGAWVGARSTIYPGVRVGAGAVVAVGSVVNRDVPPNVVVSGVPAVVTVPRIPG